MKKTSNKLSLTLISLVLLGMFGFGFALVPLYEIVCDITGLNGRSDNLQTISEYDASQQVVDKNRTVTVIFEGQVGGNLPWSFKPVKRKLEVHPGELTKAMFLAENLGSSMLIGQAVPHVSPGRAAPYFEKTECFCFSEQELAPGEQREMPVLFVVDSNLPEYVDRVSLSYTFFLANEGLKEGLSEDVEKVGSRVGSTVAVVGQ